MHMIWLICLSPLRSIWLYCRFFPFHAAFTSWLHLEPCFLWKTLYSVWCLPLVIWPEIFEKWQIYIQMYFWRPLQSQEARREVPASDYSLVKTVRWYRSVMDIDLYQYKLKIYLLSKCLMVLYFSNMQSILGWKSERASRSECQPLHVVWRVLEIQGTRAFWLISCFYL